MISKLSIPMLLFSFFLFFPNGEEGLVQNPAASQHQNWESNPALLTPMPQASSARQECWSCLNNGIISARLVKAQKWVILFHHPLHEFQWGCCIYLQMTGEVACNIGYFLFQLLGFGVGLFWSHKFKKKKRISQIPWARTAKIFLSLLRDFFGCMHTWPLQRNISNRGKA